MTRTRRTLAILWLSLLALVSTFALHCSAPAEPGATNEACAREIPGSHVPNDLDPLTAKRWIDEVRLGDRLDETGTVPQSESPEKFAPESPIHISMRVADAPAGSVVRVVVYDALHHKVWNAVRPVVAGEQYLCFTIDEGRLAAGTYETHVIVGGGARVAVRALEIANT